MQQYRSASPLNNNYLLKPIQVPQLRTKAIRNRSDGQKNNYWNQKTQQIFNDGFKYTIKHLLSKQQGLFIIHNGPVIFYRTENNQLSGNNYFFFPQGITFKANFNQQGKLQNWCTIYCNDKFLAFKYYKSGISQRSHYLLNLQDNTLIKTTYQRGKLIKIEEGDQKDPIYKQQLVLFQQQLSIKQKPMSLQHSIQQTMLKISDDTYYYGQSFNGIPNGYGLIISKKQRYFGYFLQGLLDGIGTILFPNGIYYYGEITKGAVNGFGKMAAGSQINYTKGRQKIQFNNFNQEIKEKLNTKVNKKWLSPQQVQSVIEIYTQFLPRFFYFEESALVLKESLASQRNPGSSIAKGSIVESEGQSARQNRKRISKGDKSTAINKRHKEKQVNSNSDQQHSRQDQSSNNKQISLIPLTPVSRLDDLKIHEADRIDFFANNKKTDSIVFDSQKCEQILNNDKLVKKQGCIRKPEHINVGDIRGKRRNKIFVVRQDSSVNINPKNYLHNESELRQSVENTMLKRLNE